MKKLPNNQIKFTLVSISRQFGFSIQTYHNAVHILMSLYGSEAFQYSPLIDVAALFISQKIHEVHPVSVKALTPASIEAHQVLLMELIILKHLKFRVARPLLIDDVLALSYQWDEFITGITCIRVRFFGRGSLYNQCLLNQKVQKIVYAQANKKMDNVRMSAAILFIAIKQADRRIAAKQKFKQSKSTEFIIADFIQNELKLQLADLEDEIRVVKKYSLGLKDITNSVNNS